MDTITGKKNRTNWAPWGKKKRRLAGGERKKKRGELDAHPIRPEKGLNSMGGKGKRD